MDEENGKARWGSFDAVVNFVAAPEKGLEIALKSGSFRVGRRLHKILVERAEDTWFIAEREGPFTSQRSVNRMEMGGQGGWRGWDECHGLDGNRSMGDCFRVDGAE